MATSNAWSVRMSDTVLARWANLPPAWDHEYAVLFKALLDVWRRSGDERYHAYVKRNVDAVITPDGVIAGYELEHFSLDHLNGGRLLFQLLERSEDVRYRIAIATLREQYRHHPRNSAGGFWHNGTMTNQMLLDGTYMGAPFYAECGRAENDPAAIDDALRQIFLLAEHNRDARTGLFHQGWDETGTQAWADPRTGCSASFWGRTTGWYAMAMADLLDIISAGHAGRAELAGVFKGLLEALARVQDHASGLWWNVLDQGARENNYIEASASLMFLYAFARGIALGIVPESGFRAVLDKGFDGALRHLIREEKDGLLSVLHVCKTAGLGGRPGRDGSFAYYNSEPVVENDFKGIASFILAANARESIA